MSVVGTHSFSLACLTGRLPDPRHDKQCQLAPLVSAAKEATTAADWEAVRDTAVQHLDCLQPLTKSHDVAVKVLLLQAQALNQLQQHEEALQVRADSSMMLDDSYSRAQVIPYPCEACKHAAKT